jgi:hypothetical protein
VRSNLYLVESGGSAVAGNQVFADTLQPGETVALAGPWFLSPGDTVRANAAAASVVSLTGELLEYSLQPAGMTLKVINGAALGTSETSYYACPGSGVTQTLLLNATFCNTDSSGRAVDFYRSPSGTSPSAIAQEVFDDTILPKETVLIELPLVLEPGDFLAAKAASGSVVAARFTVVEVA